MTVSHEEDPHVYRNALLRTAVAVLLAHMFLVAIHWGMVPGILPIQAEEWYTCYLIEESLSMDNLFAFYMVFLYFKVPADSQERVLRWGILGAIVMRATMISAGAVVIQSFHRVLLLFAVVLVYQGIKIFRGGGEDDDDSDETDLSGSMVVRLAHRLVPVSEHYDGSAFFVREGAKGRLMATPLLLVLVVIEMSDIVFAIDSVPAAFGTSQDPAVIFSANMFAILSLRSLYSIVAHAVNDLPYLEKAIGAVLIFVGGKMLLEARGVSVSTSASLAFVLAVLGIGAAASLARKRRKSPLSSLAEIKHI